MALVWEQPSPWSRALQCAAVTFSRDLAVCSIRLEKIELVQVFVRFLHMTCEGRIIRH